MAEIEPTNYTEVCNNPTGTLPSGAAKKVRPIATYRTDGWSENEPYAVNNHNWNGANAEEWERYLNQEKKRAATAVVAAADANSLVDIAGDYKCDGTNDEVQIDAAISAVGAAGGGTVLLTDGTFSVKDTINMAANVTLCGMGRGTKIQVDAATASDFNLVTGGGIGYWVVRDLTLDGNASAHAQYNSGIYNNGGSDTLVARCWIENMDYDSASPAYGMGVQILGAASFRNKVEGCTFTDCEASGVYSDSNQDGAYVMGNSLTGCGSAAGTLRGAIDISAPHSIIAGNQVSTSATWGIRSAGALNKVVGNYIQDTTGSGLAISGAGAECSKNTIEDSTTTGVYFQSAEGICSNNNIEDTGTHGIHADGADRSMISGNRINEAGYHGIYLDTCSDAVCSNNYIRESSQDTTNTYSHIYVEGGGSSTVRNNKTQDNASAPRAKNCLEMDAVTVPTALDISQNHFEATSCVSVTQINTAGAATTNYRTTPEYTWNGAAHVQDSPNHANYIR